MRTSTGDAAMRALSDVDRRAASRRGAARRPWRGPSSRRTAPCARRGCCASAACISTATSALSSCDALRADQQRRVLGPHAAEAGEDVVDLARVGAGVEQRPRVAAARVVAGHDREPAQRPARARSTPPPPRRATRRTRALEPCAHRDRPYGLANVRDELLARQVQAGQAREVAARLVVGGARGAARGLDVDRLIGQHDDDALDARARQLQLSGR